MRARLGFSIATSVDPDVLLLDEVLATGDQVFREKSKAGSSSSRQAAKAIVLVTHDMNWVTEFCNRAMLLEKGHVVAEGDPAEVVRDPPGALRRRPERKAEEAAALLKGSVDTASALGLSTAKTLPSPPPESGAGRRG